MPLTTESAARKDRNAPLSTELQHRHFAFIAATLASIRSEGSMGQWCATVDAFADNCAASNPHFDRDRFLAACHA